MTARPCERCGAQAAGYMDIDFHCNRRRCPIRGLLDAKAAAARVAAAGDEDPRVQREALMVLFETMLFAVDHQDDTAGMSEAELKAWVAKNAPRRI